MARFSNRDRVLTLLQAYTQREAASILGVSERTVRRWKNEETAPTKNLDVLQREAAKLRRRILRQPERYERSFHVPRLPVVPIGDRAMLRKRDIEGRWINAKRDKFGNEYGGDYVESDWVNYDVRTWDINRIVDLLVYVRDIGFDTIQLIYWRPAFAESPNDKGKKVIKEKAGKHASSIKYIENLDYDDLFFLVDDHMLRSTQPGHARGRILYVSVLQ